jgi:hypothetical protein
VRSAVGDQGIKFPGARSSEFTTEMSFKFGDPALPTYRVMDTKGQILVESQDPKVRPHAIASVWSFLAK